MKFKHNKKLVPVARLLRKNMTKEEKHLWYDFLQKYPVKYTRQKIVENYVVDFYCASAKLVIELDGSQHYEEKVKQQDEIRTKCLEKHGLLVVRIPNNEIHNNFWGVCEYLDAITKERMELLR